MVTAFGLENKEKEDESEALYTYLNYFSDDKLKLSLLQMFSQYFIAKNSRLYMYIYP